MINWLDLILVQPRALRSPELAVSPPLTRLPLRIIVVRNVLSHTFNEVKRQPVVIHLASVAWGNKGKIKSMRKSRLSLKRKITLELTKSLRMDIG